MAGPSPVLAVLVAHASGPHLDEALASVEAQDHPLDLLVVSVGTTAVAVGRDVLELPEGTGFAGAVNAALAEVSADVRYVVLLHDDVVLPPDAVGRLVERAELSPDVSAVGVKLVDRDEPEILEEVGGTIDRFGIRRSGLEPSEVDHGQYDTVSEVVFCSAACLLVRREALERLGGLDPDSFPFYEDVDLCYRLRASGAGVTVEPSVRVRHAARLAHGSRTLDPAAVAMMIERGRLRFLLKNYQVLTLALILPQYALLTLGSLAVSLVRRDFSRLRTLTGAWLRVARDVPSIVSARRRAAGRSVDDEEILALASKQAAPARRSERVALLGQTGEAWRRLEQRLLAAGRSPVTWAGAAATVVMLLAVRSAIGGEAFTLGEVRPAQTFGRALASYAARVRPEALDAAAPASPAVVLFGFLRSLPGLTAARAETVALLAPLVVAAFGAGRTARALGLGVRGRRLVAIATAVNPATLVLTRDGRLGALVVLAASAWVTAALLEPDVTQARVDGVRRTARWVLGWAVVASLHPPAVVWTSVLGLAIVAARATDGRTRVRLARIAVGVAGAAVVTFPWSLEWFTVRSPLVGPSGGMLPASADTLARATLGAGWAFAAWVLLSWTVVLLVRPSRVSAAFAAMLAAAWLAGTSEAVPGTTALAGGTWCAVVLLACSLRGVRDDLPRFALGWRQAGVLVIAGGLCVAWAGAAVRAVIEPASVHPAALVPSEEQREAGRVLWAVRGSGGTLVWSSGGFDSTGSASSGVRDPAQRFVLRALEAAREGRTHRLGALLALADVSHVVSFGGALDPALVTQADIGREAVQRSAAIFRNHAYAGAAMMLDALPRRILEPGDGLGSTPVAVPLFDGRLRVPETATGGEVYLARGARAGWRIGGRRAVPVAAGVAVEAQPGTPVVQPPGGWRRSALPLQGALVAVLAGAWVAAAYVSARPEPMPRGSTTDPLSSRRALLVPAILAGVAVAVAVTAPSRTRAGPLLSAAWYCPPVGDIAERLALVNPSTTPVPYSIRPTVTGAPSTSGTLGSLERTTVDIDNRAGAVVESYGGRLVAGMLVGSETTDTALCERTPVRTALFAEGGRVATGEPLGTMRTVYVLYNPFGELARAKIRFFTSEEVIAPPRWQDRWIEPGQTEIIDPEAQIEPHRALGAEIEIWQGRAIIARRMRRPGVLHWSVPAGPVERGVLARAATAGASTTIAAVNQTRRPARVTLDLAAGTGSLPSLSFDLEPGRRETFELAGPAAGHGDLFVQVSADPPIAIESIVVPDGRAGISVLPPLTPASRWVHPAVEGRFLLIVNPGPDPVDVSLVRLGPGPPLPDLHVAAGRSALLHPEAAEPYGVLVDAGRGRVVTAIAGPGGAAPGAVDSLGTS